MFQGIDQKTGDRSSQAHLAEMVGYLGEPPLHFLKLSPCYKDYFDDICDDEGEGFGMTPSSLTLHTTSSFQPRSIYMAYQRYQAKFRQTIQSQTYHSEETKRTLPAGKRTCSWN